MKAILLAVLALLVSSCAITRSEIDTYTITIRDTTVVESVRNAPGSHDDNGVVFPSSRTTYISRETTSYDSTHTREYPAFLRFGGLEFAGLITPSTNNGIGPGLLGVYSLLDSTRLPASIKNRDDVRSTIKGMIFRLMPMEYQLHWFEEAPNWVYGFSLVEVLAPDEKSENTLVSYVLNGNIKRRFYLRDRIPYVIASPFIGFGAYPSAYLHAGGELQVGSFGGFNLRAYLGYAAGFNYTTDPITKSAFPYFGFGVSALDFTNRVEETEREWKEYVHSGVEVSVLDISLFKAFANYRNLFDTTIPLPVTGAGIKIANAHFPLPFGNKHFWAGTSLFNYFALGFEQSTWSVLPIRAGYRHYLLAEDLTIEPYVEVNYYPSQYINIATKLRLDLFNGYTFSATLGYANGSTGAFVPRTIQKLLSDNGTTFSSVYLGVGIGLKDYLHTPEAVDAMRATER